VVDNATMRTHGPPWPEDAFKHLSRIVIILKVRCRENVALRHDMRPHLF
jgi:hypothetical protein